MDKVQYISSDSLVPKDAWDRLSIADKADIMRVAVNHGITNLQDIRAKYNEFAEGGPVDTDWSYNSWKRQVAEHMGIKPDEDNTYDYEAYFNKYPEEAWKMLKGDPTAHFSDEFKTVYHPTFSSKSIGNDGSIYSGVRNLKTNPQGLVGGTWSPDYHTSTMSPDGYRGPVSMDDRKSYLENAEDNGVVLREADGSLPIYNGIPWGGVLPNVTVYGNKHAEGGNLFRGGGSIVSDKLVDMTIKEEGFNKQPEDIGDGKMTLGSGLTASKWHDLYRKRGNKWSAADNRMAVRQELSDRERWAKSNVPNWDNLPDSSKEALLMYKYNYDFNRANSPKLFAALEAGNLHEAARQMDATSKDPKFQKGLMNRRKREQAMFLSGVPGISVTPQDITTQQTVSTVVANPYMLEQQSIIQLPQYAPAKNEYVRTVELSPEQQRANALKERFDQINRFNRLMELFGVKNTAVPAFMPESGVTMLDDIWNNERAKGGKIFIKPSHRGRLTELKKRTGKTEAELYSDGNPAHKKMVVFARNARKFKHADGGYLNGPIVEAANMFYPGGDIDNPMNYQILGTIKDDGLKKEGITQVAFLPEVTVTGTDRTKPYNSAYDSSLRPYGEFFGALAHGLQPLSPSQHVGAAADALQGKRGYFDSLFKGNSGFFSEGYTAEHPWVSTLGNMAGDIILPLSIAHGAKSLVNTAKTVPKLTTQEESLIKDLFAGISNYKKTTGAKAMSTADRKEGYQRMIDFISSPEYQNRLENAGLGDYKEYMINLIEKRLNGKNNFPAWKADVIKGDKGIRGLSEIDPFDADYGVTVRSDLHGNDFLRTFDHELAHWSTENTFPNFFYDTYQSFVNRTLPNIKLQKLMKANDKVAPTKTWKEYLTEQTEGMSKEEVKKYKDTFLDLKKRFKYVSDPQERRARAYAMLQEANRRGISTDELVDMYTIDGHIYGEAPDQLFDLGMSYTPANLKKYLKGFMGLATPITLGINSLEDE